MKSELAEQRRKFEDVREHAMSEASARVRARADDGRRVALPPSLVRPASDAYS